VAYLIVTILMTLCDLQGHDRHAPTAGFEMRFFRTVVRQLTRFQLKARLAVALR